VHWVEGRPAEGGRQVVCSAGSGEAPRERTPRASNARARVHEYGGGDYSVGPHGLVFVDDARGGLHRLRGDASPVPVTGTAPDARYAEPVVSPDGRWLVAVEERPEPHGEPRNRLMAFPLAGGTPVAFAGGHDFVTSPCFSPDGSRLAYLCWSHPHMPWDRTELRELTFGAEGPAGPARSVAGQDGGESLFQPGYSPAGRLSFVSDRSGWWNLYQERDGGVVPLHSREAEFGVPQWVLGLTTWGFASEDAIACVVRREGCDRVMRLDLASGGLDDLEVPLVAVSSLAADAGAVALVGSGARRHEGVFRLRLSDGRLEALRGGAEAALEAVSVAEPLRFPTGEGEVAHAFYYAPASARFTPTPDERPPLLTKIHGGPTAAETAGFDPAIQYWTQRGFAVVDVNHRGSTGFGRAFRERLRGMWGIVDVEDCVAAARALVDAGRADPARLAIRGGSAGGFTALSALTFHDCFGAGCSRYGIGDLAALARDTHKFESHYTDWLVAPWPAGEAVYRERSPLHHVERLSCPVIFFQGLDDRVVPPEQTETLVAALAARRIPHAYVAFPAEGHGFRRAENLVTTLEGELYFYGRIFGFDPGVAPPGVEVVGLPASGAAGPSGSL